MRAGAQAPACGRAQSRQAEQRQVPEHLVEERGVERGERRVLDRPVLDVDLDAPRQRGGAAEELLVPPVAEPADGLGQRHAGDQRVEADRRGSDPRRWATHTPTAIPSDDATGDAEAAVPDLERWSPAVVGVEPVPVGDDVVEPGADETGGHRPEGDGVDVVGVAAAGTPARAGPARRAAITPRAIISPYMWSGPSRFGARARDRAEHERDGGSAAADAAVAAASSTGSAGQGRRAHGVEVVEAGGDRRGQAVHRGQQVLGVEAGDDDLGLEVLGVAGAGVEVGLGGERRPGQVASRRRAG